MNRPQRITRKIRIISTGLLLSLIAFTQMAGMAAPSYAPGIDYGFNIVRDEKSAIEAQRLFENFEKTLLGTESVRMKVRLSSEGAVSSNLTGIVEIRPNNVVNIAVEGTFQSTQVKILFDSDGKRMRGGPENKRFDLATPATLRDGILIGFARLGLLHDLATLSSGAPPDFIDGTARQTLGNDKFSLSEIKTPLDASAQGVSYRIIFGGNPSADATIWLNPKSHLPIERKVTVHFPSGDMRVVEQYEFIPAQK